MYCGLGPKLGLVVRKCLASLGLESSEARWSSRSKSISEVRLFRLERQWAFFPLVTLALSAPEEALIYWCGDTWREHLSFKFVQVLLWPGMYSGWCTGTRVTNVRPSGLGLGGIPEGYSVCTPGGIRGKRGEEQDVSQGCRQVCPWCIPTQSRW